MRLVWPFILALAFVGVENRLEARTEMPIQFRDGLIWLEVAVPGLDRPLNFVLDSGAGVTVVHLGVARESGLKLGDVEIVEGVGTCSFACRAEGFSGAASGCALPRRVLVTDLTRASETCRRHIDGLAGADFFGGRILQIDFKAGKLRFLERCELPAANCHVLPLKRRNDAWCVLLAFSGGAAEWVRVDTGCDSALHWVANKSKERRRLGVATLGRAGAAVPTLKASVQLGPLKLNNVETILHRMTIFSGEAGLLGTGLLSRFRVTVDTIGAHLILEEVVSQ